MTKSLRALALASCILITPNLLHASSIVFTTVSADHMFDTNDGGYSIFGTDVCCDVDTGVEFTLSASTVLDKFGVGLGYVSGTNALDLTLRAGTPTGAVVESFSVSGMPTFSGLQLVTFGSSVLHPTLIAGTPYWLVASASAPDGSLFWGFDDRFADNSLVVNQAVNGEWGGLLVRTGMALEVYATDAAVPEPTSMLLLSIGIAGLIAKRLHGQRHS